mmetsp:Transcript_10261/g.18265  ORF Transcript_10261/g.18265 Transcript_10261/m.18265 type:complete len:342 (+) Transcript_10261:9-1034(+)
MLRNTKCHEFQLHQCLPCSLAGNKASLASAAARGGRALVVNLDFRQRGVRLCESRVDANAIIEMFLSESSLDGNTKTLDHLARIRTKNVGTNNFHVGLLVTNDLEVAFVFFTLFTEIPFQWLGICVVDHNAILSKFLNSIGLTVAHSAKLNWSEHSGGNVCVIHHLGLPSKKALHKQTTRLDSHWCQLRHILDYVAHGEDVGHVCALVWTGADLPRLLVVSNAGCLEVQPSGTACAADRHEHSVIDAIHFVLDVDFHLACLHLLELRRYHLTCKLHTVLFHVAANHVGNVLIKSPKQDGAYHHSGVKAKSGQEPSAFKRDVGCTDNQCLAGGLRLPEDVIG